MAQAITKEIQGSIARVVSRTETIRPTVDDRLLPPQVQERADNWNFRVEGLDDRAITHSLESSESRATDEMHENRFHLIIGGVSYSDSLRMEMPRLLHEKTIAQ